MSAALVSMVLASGCSSLIKGQMNKFADNFSLAVMDQTDPQVVADGLPSYLLLMDGLLKQNPESDGVLMASAKLNSAYASVFIDDPQRSMTMTAKALDYATRSICITHKEYCQVRTQPFEEFSTLISQSSEKEVGMLYDYASTWATYIQSHSQDWNAVAELPRVKAMMEQVAQLDETYDYGNSHLYLGVLATLIPPSLGGKPEVGKKHFERAIELSEGKNLIAQVTFAEQYARLVFDQELHDKLLNEVLNSDVQHEGLTLTNTIAQQRAQQLLDSSSDYF